MKNLPESWVECDSVLDTIIMDIIRKFYVRVFPIIIEPEDVVRSIDFPSPLFYGMLTGYKILYDKDSFFKKNIEKMKKEIRRTKPVYIEGGKEWQLAKIV
jgi:hypothetical protein